MNRGARLLPNIGAEEGDRWRSREDSMRGVARLWGLLFGAKSQLLSEPSQIPWPSALGDRPAGPAFPWIEDEAGLACWLETQDALDDPRCAGIEHSGPPPASVARVHDKAFAHRIALQEGFVPRCLRDLICVLDARDLEDEEAAVRRLNAELSGWPAWARARFTLKPRFGSSGRGRIAGLAGEADTSAIRGSLGRLAARGGLLLEPWLERTLDLSAQLRVDPEGGPLLLGTLESLVTPSGVYRGHRGWVDSRGRVFSGSDYDEPLRAAAGALARAAALAGYFGPASLDAFAFQLNEDPETGGEAREIFRPTVELNARFTLGTIALGLVRRALPELKAPLGLHPGNRRAFIFAPTQPSDGWQTATSRAGPLAHLVPLWTDSDANDGARPALLFAESDRNLDSVAEDIRRGGQGREIPRAGS